MAEVGPAAASVLDRIGEATHRDSGIEPVHTWQPRLFDGGRMASVDVGALDNEDAARRVLERRLLLSLDARWVATTIEASPVAQQRESASYVAWLAKADGIRSAGPTGRTMTAGSSPQWQRRIGGNFTPPAYSYRARRQFRGARQARPSGASLPTWCMIKIGRAEGRVVEYIGVVKAAQSLMIRANAVLIIELPCEVGAREAVHDSL